MNMRSATFIGTIAFTLMITGCIPIASTFYRTSALIGHAEAYECGGTVGQDNALTFTRHDVKFIAHAFLNPETRSTGRLAVSLQLFVPRMTTVHFNVEDLTATNISGVIVGDIIMQQSRTGKSMAGQMKS